MENNQYGLGFFLPFCLQAALIWGREASETGCLNSDLPFVTPTSSEVFLEREKGVCLCTVIFECQMDLIQVIFTMTEFLSASHVLLKNDEVFYAEWILSCNCYLC